MRVKKSLLNEPDEASLSADEGPNEDVVRAKSIIRKQIDDEEKDEKPHFGRVIPFHIELQKALSDYGFSDVDLANAMSAQLPWTRSLIRGNQKITKEHSKKISKLFDTPEIYPPNYWFSLQSKLDSEREVRSKRAKSSRRKGSDFERDIAKKFQEIFPEAKRGLSQTRNGGEVPDVDGTPFWVECKNSKQTPAAALRQAKQYIIKNKDPRKPLAVCKPLHGTIIVAMAFDDFIGLLRQFYAKGNKS